MKLGVKVDFGKGLTASLNLLVNLEIQGTQVTGKINLMSEMTDSVRCSVQGYVDIANRIVLQSTCTSEGETYKGIDYIIELRKNNTLVLLIDKYQNQKTMKYIFEK